MNPFSLSSKDPFSLMLALSLAGHASVLGISVMAPLQPKLSVVPALTSIEVTLVEEIEPEDIKEEPLETITQEQIITEKTPEEITLQETISKELHEESISEQGALIDAQVVENANPAPIYPRLARLKGWEGTVILRILVDADGKVQEINIHQASGYSILDDEALKTVKKWKFVPARVGTLKLSSWVTLAIQFKLIEK